MMTPVMGQNLQAGLSKFPFQFTIPTTARSSCPPVVESCSDFAHVLYRLKAVIDKGGHFRHGKVVCGHAIWVQEEYDIATVPDLLLPVAAVEHHATGLVHHGHVTCRAMLPRRAYVRGDVIPLSLHVDNSDHVDITAVTARVLLAGSVHPEPQSPGIYRSVHLKSEKVRHIGVPAGHIKDFSMPLPLKFQDLDENLMPTGRLDECRMIRIRYEIVVKLKRKGLHRHMELKIPIIVGNKHSSSTSSE